MPPKGRSCNQAELFLGIPGQNSLCPAEVWQHHSRFQLCCYCGLVRMKAKAQELILSPRATHPLEFLKEFYSGSLCSLIPQGISLLLSKGIWLKLELSMKPRWSGFCLHISESFRCNSVSCKTRISARWEAGRKDSKLIVCGFIFNRNFLGWALPFRLD